MKYHSLEVKDIANNLIEMSEQDPLLRYTLRCLALQTPSNQKRVLEKLKTNKVGRPNSQAGKNALYLEIKRFIEQHNKNLIKEFKRPLTEKEIIKHMIKKGFLRSEKPGDTPKKQLKRIQDGLALTRKGVVKKPQN